MAYDRPTWMLYSVTQTIIEMFCSLPFPQLNKAGHKMVYLLPSPLSGHVLPTATQGHRTKGVFPQLKQTFSPIAIHFSLLLAPKPLFCFCPCLMLNKKKVKTWMQHFQNNVSEFQECLECLLLIPFSTLQFYHLPLWQVILQYLKVWKKPRYRFSWFLFTEHIHLMWSVSLSLPFRIVQMHTWNIFKLTKSGCKLRHIEDDQGINNTNSMS